MSHPSSGPPNPFPHGQFPSGSYPPAQPSPGRYPSGYGAPGGHPPAGPHPSGPPGGFGPPGPHSAPPKKGKGRAWVVVLSVFGLLALLCCGGGGGYYGWFYWNQQQERDHRMQIFDDLGVPEGFTVDEPVIRGAAGSLSVTYYLLCEKGVCPVKPGEKIHKWLTDNGMTNMTLQDVQECLADAADLDRNKLCVFEWQVEGEVVSAHALWGNAPDNYDDRRWELQTEIRESAD
ncbi:hypothetical protein [Plantactinospora sonchi]|uniref:Uncharacterized protein n=1 Tax=Plantactinospora sonchi TaxID=1544735 RepID=A0ABU7RN88_9ACTN